MPASKSAGKNGQAITDGDQESGTDVENDVGPVIDLELHGSPGLGIIDFDGGPELEETYDHDPEQDRARQLDQAYEKFRLAQEDGEYYASQLRRRKRLASQGRGAEEKDDPFFENYDCETGRYDGENVWPERDIANPPQWTMGKQFSWHPLYPFPGEAIKWDSNVYDDGTT